MTFPVALLAGGLATRLGDLTQTLPKSLIEVAGKPFIDWQLDYLNNQGLKRVILCLGHLGEQIQAYLGNGDRYGLELSYSWDGPTRLGTGGALKRALPMLGDTFFVLYGDSYLPISFLELADAFHQQPFPILMTVFKNTNQWDTSNVWLENGILLEYNKQVPHTKMNHIDYGLSIISAQHFKDYPNEVPFDLDSVYHTYSLQGTLRAHEVYSRFYEIGTPQGWRDTTLFLSQGRIDDELHNSAPS
jgi:N-acetyl-alpha-D-muramate 1-phosphate uridylyltransferase